MSDRVYGNLARLAGHRPAAEIAADVRGFVKTARAAGQADGGIDLPAEAKVSVKTKQFSGGSSITVTITAPAAWVYVQPGAPSDPISRCPEHGGRSVAAQVAVRIVEAEVARHNWSNTTNRSDVNFYGSVSVAAAEGFVREDPAVEPYRGVPREAVAAAYALTPYAEGAERRAAGLAGAP